MKPAFLLFLTLVSFFCQASDTLFLRSLSLPERAANIDTDGRRLLIRTSQGLWVLEKGELKKLDLPVKSRFTWIINQPDIDRISVYHTLIPVDSKMADQAGIEHILPGFFTNFITKAVIGDYLYLCYRGQVLEYYIQENVQLLFRGKSVRHIFHSDSIRIISTYDGIYRERLLTGGIDRIEGTYYSSGELSEVNNRKYLCQDGLYLLQGDTVLVKLPHNIGQGLFRKLMTWNNRVWCLLNNRFSEFDLESLTERTISVRSEKLNDAEVFRGKMYVGDSDGFLYFINSNLITDTVRLQSAIWDLHATEDLLYIGCDSGVYALDTAGKILTIRENIEAVQIQNMKENLFISNNSGLYFFSAGQLYPIIENVEFNHRALTLYSNHLYAGSIDGLYMISIQDFINRSLPMIKPMPLPEKNRDISAWEIVLIIAATTLTIVLIVLLTRKKHTVADDSVDHEEITPEMIEKIIRSNDKVVSVQSLAEFLNTSIVQLNRKLKPFGTTPLIAMQESKKKIAREMYQAEEPVEKIARRTGYSVRYVKEHFLSERED